MVFVAGFAILLCDRNSLLQMYRQTNVYTLSNVPCIAVARTEYSTIITVPRKSFMYSNLCHTFDYEGEVIQQYDCATCHATSLCYNLHSRCWSYHLPTGDKFSLLQRVERASTLYNKILLLHELVIQATFTLQLASMKQIYCMTNCTILLLVLLHIITGLRIIIMHKLNRSYLK